MTEEGEGRDLTLLDDASPIFKKALQTVPRREFALSEDLQRVLGRPPWSSLSDLEVLSLGRAARIAATDRVLEIGTGTGYRAALLAANVSEVHTIEIVEALVHHARAVYERLDMHNVHVHWRDGMEGLAEQGPFDVIVFSLTGVAVPPGLRKQLAEAGRLVALVGAQRRRILRVTRHGSKFPEELIGVGRDTLHLGDVLVEMGLVDRPTLEEVATLANRERQSLGAALLQRGLIDEVGLYRAMAVRYGKPFAHAGTLLRTLDRELYRSVSSTYLDHNHVLPVRRDGSRLIVATSDPVGTFPALAVACDATEVEAHLVTPTDFQRLRSAFTLGPAAAAAPSAPTSDEPSGSRDLLDDHAIDSRMVSIFEAMLLDAVAERASDIHLEIYEERVRIRFRIDGELHDVPHYQLTRAELRLLINVLKINAGLDIAERRLPQGGRFQRRAGANTFDLRVQTQPALYGEHGIIRLLPQDRELLTIEELGFRPEIAAHYRRLLDNPGGLVLVVGPTGSGKSTTLYAGLLVLARDATRKVITVEDPIEYSLHDIQQTQVKPTIGFGFANAMRAFVREDPDVILVGEIRDGETALEAVRASQTGHLVLSTLHSNDAVDAVQRLFDLGMHPNSIASEMLAAAGIAQRLARRICTHCREPAEPEPEIVRELYPDGAVPEGFQTFRGTGCSECSGRGTHGRVAVIEYLQANRDVRRAITQRVPVDELRQVALDSGMTTMRDSAMRLVVDGVIPLSELPRLLPAERMAPE